MTEQMDVNNDLEQYHSQFLFEWASYHKKWVLYVRELGKLEDESTNLDMIMHMYHCSSYIILLEAWFEAEFGLPIHAGDFSWM